MTNIVNNYWKGLYTLKGSHLIGDKFLANSKNVSVADGSISSLEQYELFGNRLDGDGNSYTIKSHTTTKANGIEIPLRVREDGSNTHIEWYCADNETWETLLPNLTTGKVPSFAEFNISTEDEVWWCNGTENMTLWKKEATYLTSAVSAHDTTINVNSTTGFPDTGTIIYNGTEIAYTSKTDTTFVVADAHASRGSDDGVAIAADDSTYSSLPKMDILHTSDNRMWGAISTKPRLYYSQVGAATNWTSSTAPDDPGFRDFVEGQGGITGISSIQKYTIVFKNDLVKFYYLEYPTSTTRISYSEPFIDGDNLGAVNHHSIYKAGNIIYYVTPIGKIRTVQLSSQHSSLESFDLLERIRPTVKNGVFTDARLGYDSKNRTLVMAYKKSSNSARNDNAIILELTNDEEGEDFNAIGTIDWGINSFFNYDGRLLFGSSYEPNTFKAFEGYAKDEAPCQTLWTLSRKNFGLIEKQKEVHYITIAGWIADGTTIKFMADYDYQGSRATLTSQIASTETDYIIRSKKNTIGAFVLGTEPIGGTLASISDLNPFLVHFEMPRSHDPFDIQLTGYTESDIARYKIEYIAFDVFDAKIAKDKKHIKTFR